MLRAGGLILYFRHAATDFSQNDANSRGPEDCANQRNLTDRGRDDARRIGAALKAIGVPVQRVLASPTCRTVETARLIFGKAEPTTAVRSRNTNPNDPTRFEPLKALFQTKVAAGTVLGTVSHGNPFYAVAGAPYLAEGEGAVLRPTGNDWEIVARVRVEQWTGLGAAR
jgi:phosphohistidine phosphatase SixA